MTLSAERFPGAVVVLCAAVLVCFPFACSRQGNTNNKGASPRPAPVTAATATTRSVPVEIKTFGTVKAMASVAVKALVSETLKQVHFKKGQNVKKDDPLFTIDPRTFDAALQQAQANLARDTALAENARKEAARQKELIGKGITAASDYDKAVADAAAAAAAVQADRATIDTAKLQLEHCYIRSPIDGRVGNLLVDEGNLVKASDAPLVVINQIRPIEMFFSIPQDQLPLVKKYMAQGTLKVRVLLSKDGDDVETGCLFFVDNAIDPESGMVQLGARFANEAERLWPGQYVEVALTLTIQNDAVVVPTRAIQVGRDSKFVYVIKPDSTVAVCPVATGTAVDDLTIVDGAVKPGDRVVTDGHVRLTPGAKVDIKDAAKAASAPATRPAPATPGAGS